MPDRISALPVVDGLRLDPARRALLRPGEAVADPAGRTHRLPRFFFRVDAWDQAKGLAVTEHFTLAELIKVDCREAAPLWRQFPHYIPCAVLILARYLEAFRQRVGTYVCVCANGGYRSPAHGLNGSPGPHNWGTAADICRVGDTFLDREAEIARYGALFAALAPEAHVAKPGTGPGETFDHLHVDLGYVTAVTAACDEAP